MSADVLTSLRVKWGQLTPPPPLSSFQVKSDRRSILPPLLPHGTLPCGPSGCQLPLFDTCAHVPGGRTHSPGQPESRLGREGESMNLAKRGSSPCPPPMAWLPLRWPLTVFWLFLPASSPSLSLGEKKPSPSFFKASKDRSPIGLGQSAPPVL